MGKGWLLVGRDGSPMMEAGSKALVFTHDPIICVVMSNPEYGQVVTWWSDTRISPT